MASPTAATTATMTTTTSVLEEKPVVEELASGGVDESSQSIDGRGDSLRHPSSSSSSSAFSPSCPVASLARKLADRSSPASAVQSLERMSSKAAGLMIRHDSSKTKKRGDLLDRHSGHGGSRSSGSWRGGRNSGGGGGCMGRSSSFDAAEEERRDSSETFQSTMKRISGRSSVESSSGENSRGGGHCGGGNDASSSSSSSSGLCPRVDPEDRQIIRTFMLADVKTRRYRLRTYKRVFVGSDAVDALISKGLASSRDEAVRLGRMVEQKYGLFEHVHRNHKFEDEYLFYRFKRKTKEAEGPKKRGSDSKSHTTTATSGMSTDGWAGSSGDISGGRRDPAERKESDASAMSLVTCSVASEDDDEDEEEGEGEGEGKRRNEVKYPSNGFRCPFSSSNNSSSSSSSSSSCPSGGADVEPTASSEEMGMEIVHALRTGLEVRDRRYHGRTHKKCFVGRDAVSLLIEGGYTDCRAEAVVIANVVGRWYDLFEHVSGGCPFRRSYVEDDDHVFYRFKELKSPARNSRSTPSVSSSTASAGSSTTSEEAKTGPVKEYSFSTADRDKIARQWIEIFRKVDVRDRTWRLKPYHDVFVGSEAVDLLVKMSLARSRADAVRIGRIVNSQLHLFEHVTGEHDFDDEYLFFRFRE